MKKNMYFLNTALAIVLGIALLVCVLLRTFVPGLILPRLDIPNMVLLSLVALLADHYLAGDAKRCYLCIPLLSGLSFGLLPFAAGFLTGWEALWIGLIGAAVFTALTFLFSSAQERLSTGPKARLAPVLTAFGLYLACQCFAGIF